MKASGFDLPAAPAVVAGCLWLVAHQCGGWELEVLWFIWVEWLKAGDGNANQNNGVLNICPYVLRVQPAGELILQRRRRCVPGFHRMIHFRKPQLPD